MSLAALLALPEDARVELLAGELVPLAPTDPAHSVAVGRINTRIAGPYDHDHDGGPGAWWMLGGVLVQLGQDVVLPDFAGWRRARLPNPADMQPIALVPEWICEVTTPVDRDHDRARKLPLYARAGVAHYWIVDPAARTLEAFELLTGSWRSSLHRDAHTVRLPPFVEVELHIGRLFLPRAWQRPGRS